MPIISWRRDDNFVISTDPSLIPLDDLNEFFNSMEWAKPLPDEELRNTVQRSLCFALYETLEVENHSGHNSGGSRQRKLIGFARWITDMVTVAYLTDVYILPSHQGKGLGTWMMGCIDETFKSLEHLRGMILIVQPGSRSELLYRKHLAMDDLESPAILLDRKGRGSAAL